MANENSFQKAASADFDAVVAQMNTPEFPAGF